MLIFQNQTRALQERERSRSDAGSKRVGDVVSSNREGQEESDDESQDEKPHVVGEGGVLEGAHSLEEAAHGEAQLEARERLNTEECLQKTGILSLFRSI